MKLREYPSDYRQNEHQRIDALVRTHTYVKTDEKCITKTRVRHSDRNYT